MERYEIAVADKKIKERFLEVVSEKDYNREINFAIQAIRGNESLQKCDEQSIRNAIVNVALTGATLNPKMQQCFLIPRKGKAVLDFSYRGLIQIAISSGGVLDIDASVVYAEDEFYYELGLNPKLIHRPSPGNRTVMKYVYAIATLASGLKKFVVLDRKEIDAIKTTSVAFSKGSSTPWKGEFEAEMWRKSAVKKLYKYLPQSPTMSQAVATLNEHEGLALKDERKAREVMERFGISTKEIPVGAEDLIECPDNNTMIPASKCETCEKREIEGQKCPAFV